MSDKSQMFIRLSLDAEAKIVGLWGDHDRWRTSSVCDSKTCNFFVGLRRSWRIAVWTEDVMSVKWSGVKAGKRYFVSAAGYQEVLGGWAKGHGEDFAVVGLNLLYCFLRCSQVPTKTRVV